MIYLVSTEKGIKECENFEQVEKELMKATKRWMYQDNFQDEDFNTPKELFDWCMKEEDFGDIADVFAVRTFFYSGNKEIPCGLYCSEKNTNFIMKRIL